MPNPNAMFGSVGKATRGTSGDPSFARLEDDFIERREGDRSATAVAAEPTPPLVLIAFCFPAFAGFNFGYDIGSTSGAISQLQMVPNAAALVESPVLRGLLTSGSLFGAVLGTLTSFAIASPLGRRRELILAALLYVVGTAISCSAPDGTHLLTFVFLGRGVFGLGVAFAMHAAPVYIAETAPASVRGLLVALKEGFIVLGILAGFCASAVVVSHSVPAPSAWRLIWVPPGAAGALIALGMCCMPPSPRWLLLRALELSPVGKRESQYAAGVALQRFRSTSLFATTCPHPQCALRLVELPLGVRCVRVADELKSIQHTLAEEAVGHDDKGGSAGKVGATRNGGHAGGKCAELISARRALIAGLGLVLLQQVTGQPSVLYYQEAIFRDAGFGEAAAYASVIVGGAKLVATLFTVSQVDHYGRRPLLFAGITMMLVALVALSYAFLARPLAGGDGGVEGDSGPLAAMGVGLSAPTANIVIVSALMLYVCGYQVGFGPIAWLMIAEVFPLRTRAAAISVAVTVNFGCNLLVTFSLPSIQGWFDALSPGRGMAWLFLAYAAFCVASLLFVGACVPETKGKTLEQIEAELRDSDEPLPRGVTARHEMRPMLVME